MIGMDTFMKRWTPLCRGWTENGHRYEGDGDLCEGDE